MLTGIQTQYTHSHMHKYILITHARTRTHTQEACTHIHTHTPTPTQHSSQKHTPTHTALLTRSIHPHKTRTSTLPRALALATTSSFCSRRYVISASLACTWQSSSVSLSILAASAFNSATAHQRGRSHQCLSHFTKWQCTCGYIVGRACSHLGLFDGVGWGSTPLSL